MEMQDIELVDADNNMVMYIQPIRWERGEVEGNIVEYNFTGELRQLFEAAYERVDEENYSLLEQCDSILNGMGLRATIQQDEYPIHSIELMEIDTISFRYGFEEEDRDLLDPGL
jgi:hypothetical protein